MMMMMMMMMMMVVVVVEKRKETTGGTLLGVLLVTTAFGSSGTDSSSSNSNQDCGLRQGVTPLRGGPGTTEKILTPAMVVGAWLLALPLGSQRPQYETYGCADPARLNTLKHQDFRGLKSACMAHQQACRSRNHGCKKPRKAI